MKKLFSVLIVLSLLITAQTIVFAETDEIVFSVTADAKYVTSNQIGTYNADGEIEITVTLSDPVIPETVDGVSVFMFSIAYDSESVYPSAECVSGDDAFDFTDMVVSAPNGWECFGKNDSANGVIELALWDPDAVTPFVEDVLEITVPFAVYETAGADPLVFEFVNCQIFDGSLREYAEIEIPSITVDYALRPDEILEIPDGAIAIDYVGYGDGNSIFYATDRISIGEYVALYSDVENGEDKMSDYAIAIVNATNRIIWYFDTEIGESSDKSDFVSPSGHFLVAVKSDSIYFDSFVRTLESEYELTVYNLNVKATGYSEKGAFAIEDAAFSITEPVPTLRDFANVVYDHENAIIRVYETKLDLFDFRDMFVNNVTVLDANGNEIYGGYIKTGMSIDYADGVTIVMMGDVDADGEITQRDYMLIKRNCFGSFDLTGANLLAARIAGGDTVAATDYLYVKRICFNTLIVSDII